ncbi:hypothetical protein CBW54_09470 [Yersinia kristensenii]|nr:hypothetical protein CBW54_09470 [Yersinia kristensenii]
MKRRTYLTIMKDDKKDALRAAGRLPDGDYPLEYDRSQKLWFAKPEADLEKIKAWLPENTVTGQTHTVADNLTPVEEFAQVLTDAGFILPDNGLPDMDGKRHRIATEGDKAGSKSGVYQGYMDGRPAGWYQNHRASEGKVNWTSTGAYQYDPADAIKQRALTAQKRWDREIKTQEDYARMANTLARQWSKMPPATAAHSYLSRKGVPAVEGIKLDKYDNIVIPLRNTAGELRTLQYIKPDGTKNLKKDAEKTGNFFVVGGELNPKYPILYAEGYATAASLNLATGIPVVMTVDAGNMVTVSRNIKELYPNAAHIILGEDDFTKTDNKGLNKAQEAAAAIDGTYIIPQFTENERVLAFAGTSSFSDFNDIHVSRGLDAVRDQLAPVLDAIIPDWRHTLSEESHMPETTNRLANTADTLAEPNYDDYLEYIQQEQQASELVVAPSQPINSEVESTVAAPQPTDTVVEPVLAAPQPTDTVVEPTVAASQPTDAVVEPAVAAPQPTDAVVEPAVAASQPVEAPTEVEMSVEPDPFLTDENNTFVQWKKGRKTLNETAAFESQKESQPPQTARTDNNINFETVTIDEGQTTRKAIPVDLSAFLLDVTHEFEGNTVVYSYKGERAFVDHGNHITMASPEASQNTTLVLAALLVAGQHYRGKIELTGSDEFKQRAINLIAEHNLDLILKNPIQQIMLDEARKLLVQQHNNAPQSPTSGDGIILTPGNNAALPTASLLIKNPQFQAPSVQAPADLNAQLQPQQQKQENTAQAEKASTGLTGKLLEHGEAPYEFDETNNMNYYIKMRTAEGEKVIWGKEINGALADSGMTLGDIISLRCLGQQQVTVNTPVKDEAGKVLRWEKIEAMRNQWEVKSAIDNRLLVPDRQQAFPPASLLAYDMASFQQVQQAVIAASGLTLAPPTSDSALLWLQPDGRGATQHGNPQTVKLPTASPDSGNPVMTAHQPDGQLSLQLVKAHGDYLQGIILHKGEYQHVLGQLCTRENGSRYLTLNIVEPHGLTPIGYGNAVNQVRGATVAYDTFIFRLNGTNEKVVAKIDAPEKMEGVLHKKLGFTKRFTPVTPASDAVVKAENKPQARPNNTPRPGM